MHGSQLAGWGQISCPRVYRWPLWASNHAFLTDDLQLWPKRTTLTNLNSYFMLELILVSWCWGPLNIFHHISTVPNHGTGIARSGWTFPWPSWAESLAKRVSRSAKSATSPVPSGAQKFPAFRCGFAMECHGQMAKNGPNLHPIFLEMRVLRGNSSGQLWDCLGYVFKLRVHYLYG